MLTCDVLIVGAGPVGLLAALLLANNGVRVIVIEQERELLQSPRAVVYLPQSIGTLAQAGVLDDVRKEGLVMQKGVEWRNASDHSVLANIDPYVLGMDDKPAEIHRAAILLGQHSFSKIVLRRFSQKGGLVLLGHSFQSLQQQQEGRVSVIAVNADSETKQILASFVIGADGARSKVRKALGIEFEGFTHDMNFMAVNFRYSKILATGFSDAQFLVDPKSSPCDSNFAVILRTGKDDVWRCAYGDGADLSPEELRSRLPIKLKAMLPLNPDEDEYEVLQAQPYKIHQRCATTYVKGRVLLAGDAAHVNNPVGGMGLNTGILDAHAAAVAISKCLSNPDDLSINKALLQYGDLRREAFTSLVNPVTIDNLRRLWEQSDHADQQLRKMFFGQLNDNQEFQRKIQLAMNKMALGVPGF